MVILDAPGMVNCAVYFVRRERNGTFSTDQLRDWLKKKGHGEYHNKQGGITSIEKGGITGILKRLVEKGTIERTRDRHWRGVTKMPKKTKPLKEHITEAEAEEGAAYFLIRKAQGVNVEEKEEGVGKFTPKDLCQHFLELGYGCYAGAVKPAGLFFPVDDIVKILKKSKMLIEEKGAEGSSLIPCLKRAQDVFKTRCTK